MNLPRRLRHGEEATLVEHLGELRSRLLISLLAVVVGFAVSFAFHRHIIHWLNQPLPPQHRRPVTFGVAEPFVTSVMISVYAGFLLALPVVLWQVWGFLAPAFHEATQRVVAMLVVFATFLAAAGLFFGYFVALPAAVHFLTHYDTAVYDIQIRAKDYYSFTSVVLLAVTLVFELPIVILGLVRIGVLSSRKLRKNRRMGYFLMAVIAFLLPGVDIVTTIVETIPLFVLFEGSIWLSIVFEKRWQRERARAAVGELAADV